MQYESVSKNTTLSVFEYLDAISPCYDELSCVFLYVIGLLFSFWAFFYDELSCVFSYVIGLLLSFWAFF